MLSSSNLIGQVALRTLIKRLESSFEDDPFPGAFYVLSGFTPDQIASFVNAACGDSRVGEKLHIELPRSIFNNVVEERFLVAHSAVHTRSLDRTGRVILTVDSEADVGTSLNHKETITADALKSNESARDWFDLACAEAKASFSPNDSKAFIALISGVFDNGSFSLTSVASYIRAVIDEVHQGTTIHKAAGLHLPQLGVPKWEDCFLALYPGKLTHRSQWSSKLESHLKNSNYLNRRAPDGPLLDPDALGKSLVKLLEKEAAGDAIPDGLVQAFRDYVKVAPTDQQAARRLLFDHDWKDVKGLFEKAPSRSTVKKFVEETKRALHIAGVQTSEDEDALLTDLASKKSRKSGEASEDEVAFFEAHEDVITQHNPKLASEWQDFVFEKRAICSDFLVGLFDCIRRRVAGLTPGHSYRVIVEGVKHSTIADFKTIDPAICRYFQRHYAGLSVFTRGLISFSGKGTGKKATMLPNFDEDVWKELKEAGWKWRGKVAKKLDFRITFEERAPGHDGWKKSPMASIPLTWYFSPESVPTNEEDDLLGILKHAGRGRSPLVRASGNYASVGKDGILHEVDLTTTDAFSPSDGTGVCGRFIPSITKVSSIDGEVREILGRLDEPLAGALRNAFKALETAVEPAIAAYAGNALDLASIPVVSDAYRQLQERIGEVPHDHTRKQLTQLISQFGTVTIRESNRRPTVTIVCPWHPLRLEAHRARVLQMTGFVRQALNPKHDQYSDGRKARLFIRDVQELGAAPLAPDLAISWAGLQAELMSLTSHFGNYSIHHTEAGTNSQSASGGTEGVNDAARLIMAEIDGYLNLQPHERDNLAILLYNCDSSDLPARLVEELNKRNRDPKKEKVNCEILLTHRDGTHLQAIYKELVAGSSKIKGDERENDFLSRVRINLSAAQAIPASRRTKRSKAADIAFCRDELSKEAQLKWVSCSSAGHTLPADQLIAHRWQRMLPFEEGSGVARIYLTCPAQSPAGWSYLANLGFVCDSQTAKHAAEAGKQLLPVRSLDFDNKEVKATIDDTHKLGVWVLNQDQLLDRRLLEDRSVRVIRYVQSTTTGRNTVISSTARDTLLIHSIKDILREILPAGASEDALTGHARRFMDEANAVSGKLVLRAARRSNNTKELLGVVLSKYLIESQIDTTKATCWFLLDDYAHWLGKQDGKQLADLLVLSPSERDGRPHLEIAVTEAKFGSLDDAGKKSASAKQLGDTLSQIARALANNPAPADQELWLARLADMLLSRLTSSSSSDTAKWRSLIRCGECTFSLVGYSHVFCQLPSDSAVSSHKGVATGVPDVLGHQEIFNFESTREIILQMLAGNPEKTRLLRTQAGHPEFDRLKTIEIASKEDVDPAPATDPICVEDSIHPLPEAGIPESAAAPEPKSPPVSGVVVVAPEPVLFGDGSVEGFLTARSEIHAAGVTHDEAWLKSTVISLQHALHRHGMSAKLADGKRPILTPNAALIRLQGGADLTINHLEKRLEELYTTDGLKILSLLPGPGLISVSVERPDRQILHSTAVFARLLQDSGNQGEKVFIGIREEDGEPMFFDPFSNPHTLIAGATGSGKSVLVQNMLLHIALTRTPAESQIYLIDGKSGVDYLPLRHLPHIKAGSGGIIDEKEGSIEILAGLVDEMERRYQLFKEAEAKNINHYRQKSGIYLPTLWVIHDEFAEWMEDKDYASSVESLVNRLSIKSRAAGIFMMFCAQRPDNTVMPMQLRSQLGNRLILKVSDPGTAEIAVGEKNSRAEQLLKHGHMLAKVDSDKVYVQVPYIDTDAEMEPLVFLLNQRYPSPPEPAVASSVTPVAS